jgi:hypothetical protein
MTQPPLVFLRELMGDAWIDANVFGKNPKQLLRQWWKKGDQNPWVAYTESLVHFSLHSGCCRERNVAAVICRDSNRNSVRYSGAINKVVLCTPPSQFIFTPVIVFSLQGNLRYMRH